MLQRSSNTEYSINKSNLEAFPMIRCLAYALAAIFKSKSRLVAENLCLRQQLVVLNRRQPRPRLRDADRRSGFGPLMVFRLVCGELLCFA